jgi:two-component system OmpR family sensor kinase
MEDTGSPLPARSAIDDDAAELERLRGEWAQRDELLALAAHELRNPLHALSLHLSLARAMAASRGIGEVAERLARAQATLTRYSERVTVLMELLGSPNHRYPLSLARIDLAARLRLLVDNLEQEAGSRGMAIGFNAIGDCVGWCDSVVLEQIVDNLLLNAFKHSAASEVLLSVQCQAGVAVIEVADNGRGLMAEDQQHIFNKFSVATHGVRGSGSGLGLWIVRRLVEALHGSIELHSQPGSGARFTLQFPLRAHSTQQS